MVLLIGAALLGQPAYSSEVRDLGVIGKHYPIKEVSFRDYIQKRLTQLEQEGRLDEPVKLLRESADRFMRSPPGISLPRAEKYQYRYYDPSFVFPYDVADHEGKVLYKAGKSINPLHHMNYTKVMCFVDGHDELQLQWALTNCGDKQKHRLILTAGNAQKLQKGHPGVRFYFDQYGYLSQRFSLKALPSVIRQSGDQLVIEEFNVQ